jgi:hypothetical protein
MSFVDTYDLTDPLGSNRGFRGPPRRTQKWRIPEALDKLQKRLNTPEGFSNLRISKDIYSILPSGVGIVIEVSNGLYNVGLAEKENLQKVRESLTPFDDVYQMQTLTQRLLKTPSEAGERAKKFARENRIDIEAIAAKDIVTLSYGCHLQDFSKARSMDEIGEFYRDIAAIETQRVIIHLRSDKEELYRPRYSWLYRRLHRRGAMKPTSENPKNFEKGWFNLNKQELKFLAEDSVKIPEPFRHVVGFAYLNTKEGEETLLPLKDLKVSELREIRPRHERTGFMTDLLKACCLYVPFMSKGQDAKDIREITEALRAKGKETLMGVFGGYLGRLLQIYGKEFQNPQKDRGWGRVIPKPQMRSGAPSPFIPKENRAVPALGQKKEMAVRITPFLEPIKELRAKPEEAVKCEKWIRTFYNNRMQNLAFDRMATYCFDNRTQEGKSGPLDTGPGEESRAILDSG